MTHSCHLYSRLMEDINYWLVEDILPPNLTQPFLLRHYRTKTTSTTQEEKSATMMSRTRRSCVVYRRGQKHLTRFFLREAEQALELCAAEQS